VIGFGLLLSGLRISSGDGSMALALEVIMAAGIGAVPLKVLVSKVSLPAALL
jgi:hypothetical protein